MDKIKKIGRPSQSNNKREALLEAAKLLFLSHEYDKVSIRAIASEADVDSALIRYYFQSKLGLFTAMVQMVTSPVIGKLETLYQSLNVDSANNFMHTYYNVMIENPDFPILIFKIASMPQSHKNKALKNILTEIFDHKRMQLFKRMQEKGLLQQGIDPFCMQISFLAMMVYPFIMPEFMKQALQVDITPEFLTHLAQQNGQLLQHGCINTIDKDKS